MTLERGAAAQDWTVALHQTAGKNLPMQQSFTTTSDEHLVTAALSGDCLAFAELRSRHAARTQQILYRITKNWDDAEDALQECFLKVFMKLDRFENRSTFATWLTSVAINSGIMVLRKRNRKREVPMDGMGDRENPVFVRELRDSAENPEARAARREREELLRQAICKLPVTLRTVIELREMQEYSLKELSDQLGISLPAAKSRLVRARKQLQASPTLRHMAPESRSHLKSDN